MDTIELLAVVGVDKVDRVYCQCPGCKRPIYAKIHVIRLNGKITVYGSECFKKLYGIYNEYIPKYTGSNQKQLTQEERMLLLENTEKLIEKFESEIIPAPPVRPVTQKPMIALPAGGAFNSNPSFPFSKKPSTIDRILEKSVRCFCCKKPMITTLSSQPAKGYKCDSCKASNMQLPSKK
jgi:hypothetical protein